MKNKLLNKIQELYKSGENIMSHLRDSDGSNDIESILISYDFQAGTYIENAKANSIFLDKYTSKISELFQEIAPQAILEVGVGEATTLTNVLKHLENTDISAYGFDISWPRIKYANQYYKEQNVLNDLFLSTGDLFQSPYLSDSIDVVYTSHSIEPNEGREREALEELYRITKNYLVLLEPSFELANEKSRERMVRNGYITNLYQTAKELGYKIVEHRLFDYCANPLNPTGLMVIEKSQEKDGIGSPIACPVTQTKIDKSDNCYYSKEGLLAYPIIADIPCLTPENAIVVTKFLD